MRRMRQGLCVGLWLGCACSRGPLAPAPDIAFPGPGQEPELTRMCEEAVQAGPGPGFGAPLRGLTPELAARFEAGREAFPAVVAHGMALRQTQWFGLGLLDAVPVPLLRSLADPRDRDGDGVSGRVHEVPEPVRGGTAVGRFGCKAQLPSVLAVAAALDDADPDGDRGRDGVGAAADFMRLLAPPPVAGVPSVAVVQGARVFTETGCAACHVPALVTARVARVPALSARRFFPFTDLLLHDMGALGDGVAQIGAEGQEMRTAPLWGLRMSAPYLHDGRAATVTDAIGAHAGEAARAREAFARLEPERRAVLLAFLGFL